MWRTQRINAGRLKPYADVVASPGVGDTQTLAHAPRLTFDGTVLMLTIVDESGTPDPDDTHPVREVIRPAGHPVVVLQLDEELILMHESEFAAQA